MTAQAAHFGPATTPARDDTDATMRDASIVDDDLAARTARRPPPRAVSAGRSMGAEKATHVTGKPDWMTVASRAVELLARPAIVLDRRGVVLLLNDEMQRLLGRNRDESLDVDWFEVFVPEDAREPTRHCFEQVLRGALAECECKVVTKSGVRLRLRLEVSPIGTGLHAALLVIVRDAEREESELDTPLDGTHYEISVASHDWGTLRSLRTPRGAVSAARGQPCFAWLQKRSSPCPGCPATRLADAESATAVLTSQDAGLPLRMISVRASKGQTATVAERELDPHVIAQIVDAKLLVVARERHLSPRERDVLRALLRGDSSQDIAGALGISPRTVKFHQANLLRKLGAESRLELVRWLL